MLDVPHFHKYIILKRQGETGFTGYTRLSSADAHVAAGVPQVRHVLTDLLPALMHYILFPLGTEGTVIS